jgi:hypothetical protein
MNNRTRFQITVTIGALVLIALLTDPLGIFMSPSMRAFCLALLALAVFAVAILIVSEPVRDEREAAHAARAGKVGYLSGVAVLTGTLIIQGVWHTINLWTALPLAAMIASHALASGYYRARN